MRASLSTALLCTALVAMMVSVGACKTPAAGTAQLRSAATPEDNADAAAAPATGASQASLDAWNGYVQRVEARAGQLRRTIQAGCHPVFAAHRPDVAARGVAMLFHGFTACPQQFDDFTLLLTGAGYDVFVPLLPGHGYAKGENVVGTNWYQSEFVTELPALGDYRRYAQFVDEMSNLVKATDGGQKLVVGLSLGGVMATQAALSGVFTRALVLAPFFAPNPSVLVNFLIKDANRPSWTPLLFGGGPNTYVGWDGPGAIARVGALFGKKACRYKVGSAGYCSWQIKHLVAVANYGASIAAQAEKIDGVAIQFVAAKNEGAISFAKLTGVLAGVGGSTPQDPADGTSVHACQLITRRGTAQIPHSFFAKAGETTLVSEAERQQARQSPDTVVYPEKMYWLRPFLAQSVRFAVDGTPFDAQATPSGDPEPDAPYYACSMAHQEGL